MATVEEFTYDDAVRGYRRGQRWIPTGAGKPAIIYCAGHGWNGRSPLAFFDPTLGEPFYNDEIKVKEGTDPVACFAIWTASSAYDFTAAHPAWTETTYTAGDVVIQGSNYRCIAGHVSTTATHKPGTGTDWEEYWYLIDVMEIGDALTLNERPGRTPAFLESGILDLAACFAHVVENAAVYDIDPTMIYVMGESAGGQQAGAFAFGSGGPFVGSARPVRANPLVPTQIPKPAGVILKNTPNDFVWYGWGAQLGNLFNIRSSGEWDLIRDERKAALSPLGVLKSTAASIPTFLDYSGEGYYNVATDVPPYSGAPYHDAKNGWEIYKHLVDSNAQASVSFLEDHPSLGSTHNVWTASAGTGAPDYTIADTDVAAETWDWFAGQTGLTPN